jgi:transcriptional regulator of met regulon
LAVSRSRGEGNAEEAKEVDMGGTAIAIVVVAVMMAVVGYLVGAMVYSIRREKRREGLKRTWANFGLSIALCLLFLTSWAGQGLAQWDDYREEQRTHNEPAETVEFVNEFSQATLENWQSEFLQLFSFVVLAALLLHRGSAESRDTDDRLERKINEIREQLNELAGGK